MPAEAGSSREAGAARFPAEVTFGNACAALEQATAGLEAGQQEFDLSACRHFDSSLVGVLLELARRASAADGRCAFVGASANLRKLCGLYGVDEMLFGHGAPSAAAANLPRP
ncbi:MAG: anti-sigma factor antagonist [Burkholderiales bacterium]|nr:MAG: anti-sigma factor antagonist [Burkholderiales bacterium]